jgi:hypothetical protein
MLTLAAFSHAVGGGQIEIAAFRGALTGAVADIVSLFIDPPAQELGEGAVERGEQAAEEFEARLRKQSGGTMIIKRENTSDGLMGKILGVERKKDFKKKGKKKSRSKEGSERGRSEGKGDSSDSESEGEEGSLYVHSDETASEGVKEEGMVWGQLEERSETTAVTVVGNAVDLGTKALSGAMKGAIWGKLVTVFDHWFFYLLFIVVACAVFEASCFLGQASKWQILTWVCLVSTSPISV